MNELKPRRVRETPDQCTLSQSEAKDATETHEAKGGLATFIALLIYKCIITIIIIILCYPSLIN